MCNAYHSTGSTNLDTAMYWLLAPGYALPQTILCILELWRSAKAVSCDLQVS